MWPALMLVTGALLWGRNPAHAFPQPSSMPADSAPAAFITLLHDTWHWRTQESPEFATQVGINDNTAGRLDSFSQERFQKRKDYCVELLRRAALTPSLNLSFENQINLEIFKEQIGSYIDNFKYLRYFIPVTSLEGPQLHLQHLVSSQMTLESYNDFQKLLARYGEFPRQVEEIMTLMQNNLESGIMPHRISMDNISNQFSFLNDSLVDSGFFSPFLKIPLSLPPEQRRTLRQQAQERIAQDLLPAFAKLKSFLEEKYLKHTREHPGVNTVDKGEEYYAAALQFYTSTKLTAQEINALGVTEIRRLQQKLLQVSIESGFALNATLQDVLNEVRESKEYYFSTKQELLDAFRSTIYDRLKNSLPPRFQNLPLDNLTIDHEPAQKMKRGRTAWYEGPSLDGSRPGIFHIDTQKIDLISKHEVTPLSLHLIYPGQHLHAVFLQISSSIPAFRKIVDVSYWSLAPAEFSHNPAFVEGWALYSEFIGEEIGLYDTPLKRLAKVARELATASFLAVDTGIHALGWTVDEAEKFLTENTALPKATIKSNLKRVITWPGQTCSAKVGEIKLKELRQRAQNALGKLFNLDEFHNVLLQCTSSLNVVQKCVTHHIAEKINQHEQTPSNERDIENNLEPGSVDTKKISSSSNGVANGENSSSLNNSPCRMPILLPYELISFIIFILIYSK